MALTALRIKNEKTTGMYADGGGLYLRVQESGAKSWIFRFQLNGRRREMGIGTLADRSAIEARGEAAKMSVLVRSGVDPIDARQHDKEAKIKSDAKVAAGAATFAQVAKDYIAAHRAGWRNAKHADQWENTLEKYAGPVIGDKAVADVSTEDVLRILQKDKLWTKKTETATRVRSRIELVLSYAKALKMRQGENPAAWRGHLDALLPKPTKLKKVRHHPALPYDRMPEFMVALRKINGSGARALEFAILTAARSGEVRFATWSEFDTKEKMWTIPAGRMKAEKEHRIPLSDAALALLEELPTFEGVDYLFPGERDKKPLSDMSLSAVTRRMNEGEKPTWIEPQSGAQVVPHGFRSSFRDWAGEATSHPREVVEHALAHQIPDKAEAAYARGTMFDKRRRLMQDWANWCAPWKDTKVLRLKNKRATV